MDDRSKEALRFMKLPHLIKTFEEHQIDFETLKLFHEYPDTIPSVVPSLGDGLKLRRGLKLLCEGAEYGGDCYDGLPFYQAQVSLSPEEPVSVTRSPGQSSLNGNDVAILAIETSDGKRMRVDAEHLQGGSRDADHLQGGSGDAASGDSGSRDVPMAEQGPLITVHENSNLDFSKNYIREVLERTAFGKALLMQHQLSMLDNSSRCKLAEVIIQAEFGADVNTTIDGKRFMQLAKWTAECMPGELVDTYYIPSRERGKGRSPSGKFYDAYTNLNKELRRVNLRGPRTTPGPRRSQPSPYTSASVPQAMEPAENAPLKNWLEFLETHLKPWEELKEYWERTSSFRLRLLRDAQFKDLKGLDYINRYPILKQPGGYLLLEHDFGVLFREAEHNWMTSWPEFSVKLKKELVSSGIKEETLDSDAALLYNYPKLFAVVPVRIPNQKPWRASRADIQDGFLVHLKMVGDYEKALADMKKTLEAKGIALYPFPMIVGEELNNISSSYVVIDGIPLRVESPLRAVEVAFKCYHALNSHYPPQSVRLWTVLAKAVFGIDEEWLKGIESTSEVKRLISVFKCTDVYAQGDQSTHE